MLTTRNGPAVIDAKVRYWPKIAIFAPVRGSRRNIVITFRMEQVAQLSQRDRSTLRVIDGIFC